MLSPLEWAETYISRYLFSLSEMKLDFIPKRKKHLLLWAKDACFTVYTGISTPITEDFFKCVNNVILLRNYVRYSAKS
jgi:hypothetical protein